MAESPAGQMVEANSQPVRYFGTLGHGLRVSEIATNNPVSGEAHHETALARWQRVYAS